MNVDELILVNDALLDEVSSTAQTSIRRRKNRNFHLTDEAVCHRLLNAIEPGSYVAPHRHLDVNKAETMLVLRGCLGLVIFGGSGEVKQTVELKAGGACFGVDIPPDVWHSVLGLVPGTVFFEAKAGPYVPLNEGERAPWAPIEGDSAASAYFDRLRGLFRSG